MSSATLQLTPERRAYLLEVGVREAPVLARLREETATLSEAGMQISPEQGAFMGVLAQLMACRQVLEIGTFTGYSSLAMALAVPEARFTCCDLSEAYTAVARRYWGEAGVADRVDLRLGPALDTLDALIAEGRAGTYDLVFVDADKESQLAYFERALTLLREGGALLFDNVLWGGSVADPTDDRPDTVAIRALNAALAVDPRIDVVMLPVGDGLSVARKR